MYAEDLWSGTGTAGAESGSIIVRAEAAIAACGRSGFGELEILIAMHSTIKNISKINKNYFPFMEDFHLRHVHSIFLTSLCPKKTNIFINNL